MKSYGHLSKAMVMLAIDVTRNDTLGQISEVPDEFLIFMVDLVEKEHKING